MALCILSVRSSSQLSDPLTHTDQAAGELLRKFCELYRVVTAVRQGHVWAGGGRIPGLVSKVHTGKVQGRCNRKEAASQANFFLKAQLHTRAVQTAARYTPAPEKPLATH